MKSSQLNKLRIKIFCLSVISSLFITSCVGQIEKNTAQLKFIPEQIKILADNISLKAETLPEFRVDPHDKEYQGNQISGVVRTVFQDKKGDFWFGTQNGLCRYNKNGLVYFKIKDKNNQGVCVYTIIADKFGNVWIAFDGGIGKYDGTYFTIYYEKDILTKSGIWSLAADRSGMIWIGTTQGVYTFDGEALTPFEIPEGKVDPTKGVSTSKMIHSIMEDNKGNMWFATNGGAYMFDGNILKNISEQGGLQSNFVNKIIENAHGKYWISTSKGLFQYDGNSFYNLTEKLLGKDEGVGYIFEDKNGTIWFTANKRDIYSYNGETFQKIQIKEGEFSPMPFQIYQDQLDRLWFVGFKGAYRLDNNAFVNVTRFGPW
jgi:ligand-binding sensor domain-containing protein